MTSGLGDISTPGPSQVAPLSPLFGGLGIFSFFSGLCFLPQMALITDRAAQTPPHPLSHQPRPKAIFPPLPDLPPLHPKLPWGGAEHPTGSPGSDSQPDPKPEAV